MILTLLLFVPIVGGLLACLSHKYARDIALATTFVMMVLGATSLTLFKQGGFQFVQQVELVRLLGIPVSFHVGVDGISYPLVLLGVLLAFIGVLVSRKEVHGNERAYYAIFLGLIGAALGVLMSLDLLLFFVWWEVVLVLMFLLILYWGHENRKKAAMTFLVYTGISSVGLLLAVILFAIHTKSFSLLTDVSLIVPGVATTIFIAGLLTFFVKLPVVPFHTWLPLAHVEAPTAGSIILAGLLLKLGGYGILRFVTMFPVQVELYRNVLFVFAVITILYGALVCLAQYHLKRLIAYSSINHMGLVLLGASAGGLGIQGAVFAMVSHGLIAALLFGLAGAIHSTTGTFDLLELRGLSKRLPKLAWLLLVGALAGMGLPLMTGFIAEFLVLLASFTTFGTKTIIAVFGIVLTGAYMVRLLGFTLFGKPRTNATDKNVSILPFIILVIMTILLGVFPFLLLQLM